MVFYGCFGLSELFFLGNAPTAGYGVLAGATNSIVCSLPGTAGWGATFSDRPAVLWNPQMQPTDASFAAGSEAFGFQITGPTNIPIVVEAPTSLSSADWITLLAGAITNGAVFFFDSAWAGFPRRFYRFRSPWIKTEG
jgi:hypothetical protein